MSVSTVTNLSNSLRRTYADRYFKAFQQDYTPILDEIDECPDEPTYGVGWFFPFYESTPQNWRTSAEGGGMGTVEQRTEEQGQVNSVEFLGWLQISEKLKNVGVRSAAWNGGEVNRQMKETMFDITRGMQRMFTISHGTGRLAVVESDVTSGNSFVAKLDEGVNDLEVNDRIDFYDLDTGGTITAVANRKITKIVRSTRTVTFDGAAAALTANWGVYKTGDYGRAVNGIHGLIDNGIFQDDLHGQSRATHEKLKSVVVDPGTPTELTEEHIQEIFDGIYLNGGTAEGIWCNTGVLNAIFALQAGDRRYNIERGTAKFQGGFKEGDLMYNYDKGSYVVKKNPQLPARTLYVHSLKTSFYKHTTKKLGWLDEGGSILRLTPDAGSDGYKTSWTAMVYADVNLSCYGALWNGVRRNILDRSMAGDS